MVTSRRRGARMLQEGRDMMCVCGYGVNGRGWRACERELVGTVDPTKLCSQGWAREIGGAAGEPAQGSE